MNRHGRRATKAAARGQALDRSVSVHEAGHCVARVLLAESLGWGVNEVVKAIDIYPAPVGMGVSFDGVRSLQSQATSWGQFLSKPMQEFLAARVPDTLAAALRGAPLGNGFDLVPIFAEMRSAGIDLDWWFRAKSIEAIFGPMAEAKLTGKPFDEVWNDYSSEADLRDVIRNGTLCGMTKDQLAERRIVLGDLPSPVPGLHSRPSSPARAAPQPDAQPSVQQKLLPRHFHDRPPTSRSASNIIPSIRLGACLSEAMTCSNPQARRYRGQSAGPDDKITIMVPKAALRKSIVSLTLRRRPGLLRSDRLPDATQRWPKPESHR